MPIITAVFEEEPTFIGTAVTWNYYAGSSTFDEWKYSERYANRQRNILNLQICKPSDNLIIRNKFAFREPELEMRMFQVTGGK